LKPLTSLRKALTDPGLFGQSFGDDSWHAWRTLLLAIMGEELTAGELDTFRALTQRDRAPTERVEEFVGVIGRRGGKSRAMGVLAAYLAGLCDHTESLAAGERGVVLLIAPDQRQSRLLLDYVEGALRSTPLLAGLIEARTQETLSLSNGIDVEVRAASFRRLRGLTAVAVIADEAAFWFSAETSQNTDSEILAACRPALATTKGPLIVISSPYAKRGEVYEIYRQHFGASGDKAILVAQAPSVEMNPSPSVAAAAKRAYERDPASADAEYGARFRIDIGAYIDAAVIQACTDYGVTVRPPQKGVVYKSFCDPSGGSRDSFTCAISHMESNVAILDALHEVKPPFNPTSATQQIADLLLSYNIKNTVGDRYAGQWVIAAFAKCGIKYAHSARNRSELYLDCMPLLTSGRCRLLDNRKLAQQFGALERRTSSLGKDVIDHGPNGHDDSCNSAAGALVLSAKGSGVTIGTASCVVVSQPRVFPGDMPSGADRAWDRLIQSGAG
jgi:hypothetical protein